MYQTDGWLLELFRFQWKKMFFSESSPQIFSPAYRRTLETEVSVTDDDDVMTLLIDLS